MLYGLNEEKRDNIKVKYGSAISFATTKMSYEKASYLYELPSVKKLTIDNKNVILCHGSPWDRDIYIYPDANQKMVNKM